MDTSVQKKLNLYKKQYEDIKTSFSRFKWEYESASKKIDEIKNKCKEIGIDPDNLDKMKEEYEEKVELLSKDIESDIREINTVIEELDEE